ncbi:MAG: histone deacetylase family protein [Arenicellales bacterium WSBS_2016_MAG_OTU3]
MQTVYSEEHYKHQPQGELNGGILVPPFENPQRVEYVLESIADENLGEVITPEYFGEGVIARVHDQGYLKFLRTCWREWIDAGYEHQILATVWPARRHQQRVPNHIDGKVGYYAHSVETAIVEGTWQAAQSSVDVALTASKLVHEGEGAAFGLCRPPGHHACKDMYGGYCFLNNAAIAAQYFLDNHSRRVAILDPDFHHGNGTQDIFYDRDDVFYLSLHGAPEDAYPHFLGYADEKGEGAGAGYNQNYPMPPGTPFSVWNEAFMDALAKIKQYNPDVLIVSLGVDTFENDPISFFKLTSDDFKTYGNALGKLGMPTVFLMEGGYAVEQCGTNTVNVLTGFEDQG